MFRESQKSSKLFIQGGDPSQNSALARTALKRVGAKLLAIRPRSADLNPIENIFNVIKKNISTIASMHKRIDAIIGNKGSRTKY